MFAEGETYTLIINNVYGVDADEYVCRAVNKGGAKSTKAELVIMSEYISVLYIYVFFFKRWLSFFFLLCPSAWA